MRLNLRWRARRGGGSSLEFLTRADALFNAGKKGEALKRYDQAVARWPADPDTSLARGLAVIAFDLEEGLGWCERAAKLAWDDPGALISVAGAMTYAGQWARAEELARRIDETKPPDFAFVGELGQVWGMALLNGRDDAAAALPHLETAYSDTDVPSEHGHSLICAYIEVADYTKAADILRRELAEHPDDEYLRELQDHLAKYHGL